MRGAWVPWLGLIFFAGGCARILAYIAVGAPPSIFRLIDDNRACFASDHIRALVFRAARKLARFSFIIGAVERERRDHDSEVLIILILQMIAAAHHAGRR